MEQEPQGLDEPISIRHAAKLMNMTKQGINHAMHRGALKSRRENGKITTTARWLQEYSTARYARRKEGPCHTTTDQ